MALPVLSAGGSIAWANAPGAGRDGFCHGDGLAELPERLLVVEPDCHMSLRDTASLDVEVLAGWLNEARAKDHESAFSNLIMAKDLIRRLVGRSLVLGSSHRDLLHHLFLHTRITLLDKTLEAEVNKSHRPLVHPILQTRSFGFGTRWMRVALNTNPPTNQVLWNRNEMEARRFAAEEQRRRLETEERLVQAGNDLCEMEASYKARLDETTEKLGVANNDLFEARTKLRDDGLRMEGRTGDLRIALKQMKELKAENAALQERVNENLWQKGKLDKLLQRIALCDNHTTTQILLSILAKQCHNDELARSVLPPPPLPSSVPLSDEAPRHATDHCVAEH